MLLLCAQKHNANSNQRNKHERFSPTSFFILCYGALVVAIIDIKVNAHGQNPADTISSPMAHIRKKSKIQNQEMEEMEENEKYKMQCDNPNMLMPLCDRTIPGV